MINMERDSLNVKMLFVTQNRITQLFSMLKVVSTSCSKTRTLRVSTIIKPLIFGTIVVVVGGGGNWIGDTQQPILILEVTAAMFGLNIAIFSWHSRV